MNYYPFHLGDYAAHTGHLEPMEDLAYRRMIDAYYLRECPLPSDVSEVARLIRMRANVDEVGTVLAEFFVLDEEGWRHFRCDEEIERMQDKQAASEQRAAHESDRMKRHRERRAEMFAALREVGVVPAWDVSMKELQRLHNESCNAPETHLKREQTISDNAPATAIPTPTPTPTPTPIKGKSASAKRDKPASVTQPEDVSESVWQDFLAVRQARRAPLTNTALDNIRREAGKAGMTLEAALGICCTRGWSGFNASWEGVKNFTNPVQQTGETQYQRAARERAAEWSPSIAKGAPAPERQLGQVIDGDVVEVKTNLLGAA